MKKIARSLIVSGVLAALVGTMSILVSAMNNAEIAKLIAYGLSGTFLHESLTSSGTLSPAASEAGSFHFLEPIAPSSGDPSRFDPSLLNYLSVEVCRVSGSDCLLVKTFTPQSPGSEQLRIPNNAKYYIANWDTLKVNLNDKIYRIRVLLTNEELGSIDLAPNVYKTFGRTWPIKFLIERDPALHVGLLRSLERSCSQVASVLKNEFGLDAEAVALLLADGERPCSAEEIDLAIKGVFQNVMVPSTTKVADQATRNALISFDPATGRMIFSSKTALVSGLKRGDVVVSEPSAAAPNGFLRKITAVKNGGLIFETSQASFNDAIRQGTLDAAATLRPGDLLATEPAFEGVSFRKLGRRSASGARTELIGEDYDFETSFDVTIDGSASDDDVSGDGHVRIQGFIRFNAGYDVGFGVEPCFKVPPVCVDRMEARLGIDHYSSIRVSGEFNGTMQKEYKLSTHYFKPIVFFIGPVPVVLVPVINAVVGANGEAHLKFSFAADLSAQLLLGAKWTEENGWEDLSRKNGIRPGIIEQNLDANMKLRAYGKADGKLLFYGVAGPGFDSRIGGGADVQVPRRPWWRIFGYIGASINFQVDLGGLLKLNDFSKTVLDEEFTLVDAPNQAPRFSNVNTDVIQVDIGRQIVLGPRTGFGGYFDVVDLEGDPISFTATSNAGDAIDPSLVHTFQTGGLRTITITARDGEGATSSITLTVNVNNSPPIVTILAGSNSVPATVQYIVSARAFDFETGALLGCGSLQWQVSPGPYSLTRDDSSSGCVASIVFNAEGSYTVTAVATDVHGGVGSDSRSVSVTTAPQNRPPVVDIKTFSVTAIPGPRVPRGDEIGDPCPFFFTRCKVPNAQELFDGVSGDWITPLNMSVMASDPEGDPITYQWFCESGTQVVIGTEIGGGIYACPPPRSGNNPVYVYAKVSDGVNPPVDSPRGYYLWPAGPN